MEKIRPLKVRKTLVVKFIGLLKAKWTKDEYAVRDQKPEQVSDEKLKKVSHR